MSEHTNTTEKLNHNGAQILSKEIAAYEKLLPSLLKDSGKFALISGGELTGIYAAYEDALKIGYEKYGMKPFLVRKIAQTEQVGFISRMVVPCPA